MISYALSDEHQELRQTVAAFARDVVRPVIGGYYERAEFPYDLIARMAKLGLFGLPFPAEFGGMDGDLFALGLALEELARVDSSVAITLEAAVALGAIPIYRFGTDAQRRRWLPELCSGERLAAFGLTEAGGGSDIPGGMRTTARLETGPGGSPGEPSGPGGQLGPRAGDGEWVIDGAKSFITNSGTAITSLITVLAISGGDPGGPREISSIVVPAGTPGLTVGHEYSKVGWCASDTREVAFASCRVPGDHLLGGRVRPPARALPGHPVQDRRHGGAYPLRAAGLVRRRGPAGSGGAGQTAGGHREAHRLQRGDGQRAGGYPDLRRLRVHERVPGRALLPGRQGARDRGRHL